MKFGTEQWLPGAALTGADRKIKQMLMSPSKPDNLSADLMNNVI